MKTFLAFLRSLTAVIEAFVAAGGVQILVDHWRERGVAARAAARAADAQRFERELASGDPARVERAAVELLQLTERASDRGAGAGASGRQPSRDRDHHAGAVPSDGLTAEGLSEDLAALGLVD